MCNDSCLINVKHRHIKTLIARFELSIAAKQHQIYSHYYLQEDKKDRFVYLDDGLIDECCVRFLNRRRTCKPLFDIFNCNVKVNNC